MLLRSKLVIYQAADRCVKLRELRIDWHRSSLTLAHGFRSCHLLPTDPV